MGFVECLYLGGHCDPENERVHCPHWFWYPVTASFQPHAGQPVACFLSVTVHHFALSSVPCKWDQTAHSLWPDRLPSAWFCFRVVRKQSPYGSIFQSPLGLVYGPAQAFLREKPWKSGLTVSSVSWLTVCLCMCVCVFLFSATRICMVVHLSCSPSSH